MSYDQLKQMPKTTVFGKIMEISNPAVKRNDSINAVSVAVARAITTMDHSKFDATVDVALVAKDSTVSYIKARDGFIITSIPNVKDSMMGLDLEFRCPDTDTGYKLKIMEHVESTSGKKRNNTVFKGTAGVRAGSTDAEDTAENTAIVTSILSDFLGKGNCELTDVRRGGSSFATAQRGSSSARWAEP